MFVILKFVLIILVNRMYGYITQDNQIILLPAWNLTGAKEKSLTFKVFGKLMQLNLRRNDQLVSSVFKVWKNNEKHVTEKLSKLKTSDSCFYLYEDHVSSAAINICQEHGLEGFIFVENNLLEIRPLQNVFASSSFINDYCVKEQINQSFGKPHIIKRLLQYFPDLDFNLHKIRSKRSYVDEISKKQKKITIELAVFVDAEAYNSIMKLLHFDFEKVLDVMLAYVSRIQALFYHSSLGVQIGISLVRLEFMEKQPKNLSTYDGNSIRMHNSFCAYATNFNPRRDNDPRHFDIGLYITGLSIFKIEFSGLGFDKFYQRRVFGISNFNEVCNRHLSCVVVSLPSENYLAQIEINDDKYSKFKKVAEQSSVIATHEIGHLLGLNHDVGGQMCGIRKEYIMCQEILSYSGIKWSPSSRNNIKIMLADKSCLEDHTQPKIYGNDDTWSPYALNISFRPHDSPGRKCTAKAQCELLLHDENANVVTLHDICRYLQCELSNQTHFFPGSTLQGTYCSYDKECRNGECVPVIVPPYNFNYCVRDNWSEWQEDLCKSDCLEKSRGVVVKRRFCKHRNRKTANCSKPYYDTALCDDTSLCALKTRKTVIEFATKRCFEFSKFVKNANMTLKLLIASASQMLHDVERPWLACTVFCRREDIPDWYTPRQNMFNHSVDPYFPDGTWCHNEGGQDYYCRQHYCLPQSYSFVESEECKSNC